MQCLNGSRVLVVHAAPSQTAPSEPAQLINQIRAHAVRPVAGGSNSTRALLKQLRDADPSIPIAGVFLQVMLYI